MPFQIRYLNDLLKLSETSVATSISIHENLFAKLNAAGIATTFARKVLPEWWDAAVASTPSGLQQTYMYLARGLNLDLVSLVSPSAPLKFLGAQRKFKLNKNVEEQDVSISAHYATAIAKIALKACDLTQMPVPADPVELRNLILQNHKCVSLEALLLWCGKASIPVLHIDKLPGKKMTGLVVREGNKFAIVLSKKATPSHHVFHLAHELGHIARGHLSTDGFVADQNIGGPDNGDADEKEADAYAIRLLNGRAVEYRASFNIKSGKALYLAAQVKAEQEKIDVGHIILNYGFAQNAMAIAAMALRYIPGEADGAKVINQAFFKALDSNLLSEDQLNLLQTATNTDAFP